MSADVFVTGTERGSVRATGKSYEQNSALLFKVRDGMVKSFRCHDETDAVAQAFR